MKKYFLLFPFLFVALLFTACKPKAVEGPCLQLSYNYFDFGNIPVTDTIISFDVPVKNIGNQCLEILDYERSCAYCTRVDMNRFVLGPGGLDTIRISYDVTDYRNSVVDGYVIFFTNNENHPTDTIFFKASVD